MSSEQNINETEVMRQEAEKCEDIDDIRQFINRHSEHYVDWKAYISQLIEDYCDDSHGNLAKRCGFSVNTVKSWCNDGNKPRGRKEFLKLGLGLGFDLNEMNRLLQRYGRYHKLYAKNIEDAICIFAVSNKLSFAEFEQLKKEFVKIYAGEGSESQNDSPATEVVQSYILNIKVISDLRTFIAENSRIFSAAYERLIKFIEAYIKINIQDFSGMGADDSLNAYLTEQLKSPKLVTVFNDMVSKLRCHKTIPDKTKLIAFGLYLNMTLDDVNLMLNMAGIEPLCAKDKLESVLIYALNNIAINNPGMEFSNAMLLEKYTNDKEVQLRCAEIIREHYNCEFADAAEYDENDERRRGAPDTEDLIYYIKEQISDLQIENSESFFQLLSIE